MLNVTAILDRFESSVTDNTTELRSRALIWLNMIFQRLAHERDWMFLRTTVADQAIVSNQVTLPADFRRLVYLVADDNAWSLTADKLLSQQEATRLSTTTADAPRGFTLASGILTLHPAGVTATACDLTYVAAVPEYTDSAADTLFPDEAGVAIHRLLLSSFYEYDFDERAAMAGQMAANELRNLKQWDNTQRPQAQYYTPITVTNYAP